MWNDKQQQKAGDNSQQYQAQSMIIVNGITEERVRAIFDEQSKLACREYTEDAYRIANERVGQFEERLMSRITKVEDALSAFAEPSFQFLLRRAQLSAAVSDQEVDYDLLTELLVCHVQKGSERKNRAAINRAVEIVDEIDNDALCALTVVHALSWFYPMSGSCTDGLRVLNDMFDKLLYQELPLGIDWLDHLDVLGAIRLNSFGSMKKISQHYSSALDGYMCTGIEKDSEKYRNSLRILKAAQIPTNFLVPNECLENFVRLSVRNRTSINILALNNGALQIPFSNEQINAANQIFDMYEKDSALKDQAEKRFMEIWDSFPALNRLRTWWDQLTQSFSITQVGRVLAQTNAKRCDPNLPDLL